MPTYYTAEVGEKPTTFKEFVQKCTSNFVLGASDLKSGEWPKYSERSTHYNTRIIDALKDMEKLLQLTLEEVEKEAEREYLANVKLRKEHLNKTALIIARYRSMYSQVEEWVPPTKDHENFKLFMLEQLKISIEGDDLTSFYEKYPIKKLEPEEWLDAKIKDISEDIQRAVQDQLKDDANTKYRNKWIKDLKESVK